ncbi:unnamed protein product [Lupinus luteus]|uniref:Uncharacterized protein n=1 Tax=Lupinus luteus TaxID=3873 RepID=A0AAV1W0H4_LUPLU
MAKPVKKSSPKKNGNPVLNKLPEGIEHWIIRPMQRKNGKIYKIYIHKVRKITLRSVKEVERFEMYGSLPNRKGNKISKKKTTLKKKSNLPLEE